MDINLDSLSTILEQGESVEWAGRSEPFPLVDSNNKGTILIRAIVSFVLAAVITIVYVLYMQKNGTPVVIAMPIILFAVAAFVTVRPIMDARVIQKKRLFLITDRNIINYESDSSYKKMALSDADEVKFIDKGNGLADVLFGSPAVRRPYRKIRSTVLIAQEKTVNDQLITVGTAFYNIRESGKIRALLPASAKITEEKLH